MRPLRVYIIKAETCGGLLDGLDVRLRSGERDATSFDPFCLIGPNGAGKSQFLQALAEIFQSIFHSVVPADERLEGNPDLEFEVEYLIRLPKSRKIHTFTSRESQKGKRNPNSWSMSSRKRSGSSVRLMKRVQESSYRRESSATRRAETKL